jgi:hypothetical protein
LGVRPNILYELNALDCVSARTEPAPMWPGLFEAGGDACLDKGSSRHGPRGNYQELEVEPAEDLDTARALAIALS